MNVQAQVPAPKQLVSTTPLTIGIGGTIMYRLLFRQISPRSTPLP
jgi:hypothetical protein